MAPQPDGAAVRLPDRMQIMFCCNPGYFQHLAVAMRSLLENNAVHPLGVTVVTTQFDAAAEARVRRSVEGVHPDFFLRFVCQSMEAWSHFFIDQHVTLETYLRLMAVHVLPPEVERVLYLDADLVVVGDLAELWRTDLQDMALAAVPDPWGQFRKADLGIPPHAAYVNAGVTLMNLDYWRRHDVAERLVAFIEARGSGLMFHDQDAINAVLHDAIRPVDFRWNFQARMYKIDPRDPAAPPRAAVRAAMPQAAIIHYNGRQKPWHFMATVARKGLYRRYLRRTAWRDSKPEGWSVLKLPHYGWRRMRSLAGSVYRMIHPSTA